LKTLEEPPDHVKFLLATTDPQKLPVTVLSRCLQFHLRRLPAALIRERLLEIAAAEGVTVEPGASARLARAADGSMRDALSLLDQALAFGEGAARDDEVAAMLGDIERGPLLEVLDALARGDGEALVAAARRMAGAAVDFDEALAELVATVHTVALAQQVPGAVGEDEPERDRLLELAGRIAAEDLQLYYQIGLNARRDLPYAPDPATGFEMALLRMHAFRPAESPPRGGGSGDAGRGAPGADRPGGGAGHAAAPDAVPEGKPAASGPAGEPAAPPAAGSDTTHWESVVSGLDGPLRALASHCQWAGREGQRVTLRLDPAHEYLNSADRRDRLREALAPVFGDDIQLHIEVGSTEWTPAESQRHRAQARQAEAEQALADDPALREMCEAFDGQLYAVQPPEAGNNP